MRPIRFVDAHHHFWDPVRNHIPWLSDEPPITFRYGDYSAIRKPYLVDDYLADAAPHQVRKTVYVETEWDPADPVGELEWIHAIAERHGYPNAVVAQAWLDRDDVGDVLGAAVRFPLVRGVRHKPAAAASPAVAVRGAPGSMDDDRWRDGFAQLGPLGLRFDLQTPWWHLDAGAALARDFPATPIILNHTGLPVDRTAAGLAAWRAAMAALADSPNVCVKISGLGQRGVPWTVSANEWIVRETIAIFGVARCAFATNFPVDSLCGSYRTILEGFAALVADLDEAEREALFVSNALRWYDITDDSASTQTWTIRSGEVDDLEAVRECAREAYTRYVERIGKAPAPMVADFARAIAAGELDVLILDGVVVGYVVYYPRADHVHLENVAVRPGVAGRGLGGALIGHVEAAARRLGVHAVELYTNAKMTENLAMYPRLGYCEIDRRKEDGFERVYFRKRIVR